MTSNILISRQMKTTNSKSKTDTSGVHLWLVLWKASRMIEAHSTRSIDGLGMCLSDFGVLEALLHKGPLTVKELGAKVLLTSGSMTAAIDRLISRGFVEREEDAKDRRVRVVRLTAMGRAMIRDAFEDHKVAMEQAVAGLNIGDRAVLIDLLRRLGQSAEGQLTDG